MASKQRSFVMQIFDPGCIGLLSTVLLVVFPLKFALFSRYCIILCKKTTWFFQAAWLFRIPYFSKTKSNPARKTSELCFSGKTKFQKCLNSAIFEHLQIFGRKIQGTVLPVAFQLSLLQLKRQDPSTLAGPRGCVLENLSLIALVVSSERGIWGSIGALR